MRQGPQARDLENVAPGERFRRDVERLEVAADHQADHRVAADLVAAKLADDRAVAQDDDPVGALLDLVQAVGDEDDRHAVGLELADDPHQPLGLGGREARRRLVHDDDARVERQRLGDLEQLALGEREVGDQIVDLEVDVEAPQQRRDDALRRPAVDELQRTRRQRLAPDQHIGADVEIVEEVQFLVNEGDARTQRFGDGERGMRGAVDLDRALVGLDHAAQDLHQRRLAGAVLADQRENLAALHAQADTRKGADAGIGLADVDQPEEGIGQTSSP